MSTIRPTTVEVETSLRLVAPDATALPVRASLRYDPADPYAVHVLFHAESAGGEAVSWSFARELLVTGHSHKPPAVPSWCRSFLYFR